MGLARGNPNLWRKSGKAQHHPKVKCFTWLVTRRSCLTHEVLQKRGLPIVSTSCLYSETVETNSHLFLYCRFTTQIWAIFFSLTKVNWTMLEYISDLLKCWVRRGRSRSQKKWWRRIIPSCIWWSVWKERNERCLEDRSNSLQKVKWN